MKQLTTNASRKFNLVKKEKQHFSQVKKLETIQIE